MKLFIIIVAIVALYFIIIHFLSVWVQGKIGKNQSESNISAKQYAGKEHVWTPTFHLEHKAVQVFNIPFVPEENEVFYIENEYDKEANLFIQENLDLIKKKLASKGLTFVYLPWVHVSKDMAESMMTYFTANPDNISISEDSSIQGIENNFLLNYMVYPENRTMVKNGFAWFNTTKILFDFKKVWYVFDYISFDGAEARQHPNEVLEEMLSELGTHKIWRKGLHSEAPIESECTADDNFDDETKKILSEIQEKLNSVRLKGISEAIIARYVNPCPKLSRITISHDFTITLNDYNNTVIPMEPVVKAIYILFLRHPEGINFKDLPDYRIELEIIYRAIKKGKNNIDEKLSSGFIPQVSRSVEYLTDPFSNSINEKCTRIKEAFIVHFHESISSNYYIRGSRASKKLITIPRNLIIWEGEK